MFVQKTNRSKQSSKCRKSHFMLLKFGQQEKKGEVGGGDSQFSQLCCRNNEGVHTGEEDANRKLARDEMLL